MRPTWVSAERSRRGSIPRGLPQLQVLPEVDKEDGDGERSACRQDHLRGAGVTGVVARFGPHVPAMLGVATWKLLIPSPVAWPALVSLFQR